MKILIVDDEHLARERLKSLIARFPAYRVIGEAGDGKSALDRIAQMEPDIVLLDIRMPGMDGLQVARALTVMTLPPAIIFTTAYSEHALSAFDTAACAYLLKPVRREKLAEALKQARRPSKAQLEVLAQSTSGRRNPARSHIIATTRDGQKRIPVEDILFFEADQKYTTVHHLQGEVLIEESLRQLEADLLPQFLRVHRKILVNTAYITNLHRAETLGSHGGELQLRHTEKTLPVSRRRLAEVRRLLFKGS